MHLWILLKSIRSNKWWIKLFRKIGEYYYLSLISLRIKIYLKKKRVEIAIVIIFWICAKKLMMNICMHEHIFIITTRSKRYVKVLLQKIHFLLFCLIFCCGRYKTHLMCKKYHHCSFLSASRQVSNWFVKPKTPQNHKNTNLDQVFTWCNKYKQRKACKTEINEELIPLVWYPSR